MFIMLSLIPTGLLKSQHELFASLALQLLPILQNSFSGRSAGPGTSKGAVEVDKWPNPS